MQSTCKLTKTDSPTLFDPYMYKSMVKALQYAIITRPAITFFVNKVCQYMAHPLEIHWMTVKRILRYLKGTLHHSILLSPMSPSVSSTMQVYCDANWASDPYDPRSTSGVAILFSSNVISWWSKKHTIVAISNTEVEYRSMAQAIIDLMSVQTHLEELCITTTIPVIHYDNQPAMLLAHNLVLH